MEDREARVQGGSPDERDGVHETQRRTTEKAFCVAGEEEPLSERYLHLGYVDVRDICLRDFSRKTRALHRLGFALFQQMRVIDNAPICPHGYYTAG